MGHTSFALLKLACVDGKQRRQASPGIEKSHAVTVVAETPFANEVLSHETPLKRRHVIPICYFITAPAHSTAATVAAAVLHSALSENRVIKKHLTFFAASIEKLPFLFGSYPPPPLLPTLFGE